ncbi:MAG: helix-turn-helix domain-containing protein [Luteitalea sp.]|nr:helix-turn-helix domain-containing protein [Luteitalea sp.]
MSVDEMVRGVRDRASDDDTPVSGSARETRRQSVGSVPRRKKLRDPEYSMTVSEAAQFLGVSPQTVYLWVERKQIPHLRVMGRNIRFLRSDLEPFRNRFKQEVEDGTTT